MRRQLFIASKTDRARALITLMAAQPKDPKVAEVHRRFVQSRWAITPGHTYLEGLRVADTTDQRTAAFLDALMHELVARGLVERSVDDIESLAAPASGPAYGIPGCHDMSDDLYISRGKPKSPDRLSRPEGVAKGTRVHIVVRAGPDGQSTLAGVVNDDPDAPAAQACFDAVDGAWPVPKFSIHTEGPHAGKAASYCSLIHCRF